MAHLSKKQLKIELDRTINAPANRKKEIKKAYEDLIDTAIHRTPPEPDVSFLTTSGSGVVNIPIVQPANTVLTDCVVLCTADAELGAAALVGLRIGTAIGGTQIANQNNAFNKGGAALTTIAAGKGTSIHAKIAASLSGSDFTFEAYPAVYTTTERTLHVQISGSTGDTDTFDTNTGAFKPILHFERL